MKLRIILIFTLLYLFSAHSFEAKIYDVSISVYHKGQLIAQPDIRVNEGEKSNIMVSLPGSEKYNCTVLINSTTNDRVDVSVNFTSGGLVFNPEFVGVKPGEKVSSVMNDFEMKLFIE